MIYIFVILFIVLISLILYVILKKNNLIKSTETKYPPIPRNNPDYMQYISGNSNDDISPYTLCTKQLPRGGCAYCIHTGKCENNCINKPLFSQCPAGQTCCNFPTYKTNHNSTCSKLSFLESCGHSCADYPYRHQIYASGLKGDKNVWYLYNCKTDKYENFQGDLQFHPNTQSKQK